MAQEKKYAFKKEDNKSSILLIGVLLVLIVIVGSALVLFIKDRMADGGEPLIPPILPNVTEPNITNVTNVTDVLPCDDQCLYERAIRDKNFSDCRSINDTTLAQECYEQLSDVSLDACMAVEDETKRKNCITAFAIAEDDVTLCDLLDVGREECKEEVDPCLTAEEQDLCYALKNEDPSECQGDKDCLLDYSITMEDTEACDLIQHPAAVEGCKSVIEKRDRCPDLAITSERDYCYEIYAIYSNDVSYCPRITGNTEYALDCYSIFAAREGNISVCDRDDFYLDMKWDCYTNYSLLSGDLEGCRQIHELAPTHRFACAFEYAKKYGNPAACDVIVRTSSRSTCYQGAIIYSNENLDWSYCDDILDFDWRNKCFSEAAKLYDDVSLCDYITVEYAQEACRIAYEAHKSS